MMNGPRDTTDVIGTVKWFCPHKGYGFLVCDPTEGDVLIHISKVKKFGLKTLPEGAVLEVSIYRHQRGLQVDKIISADMRTALPPRPPRAAAEQSTKKWHGPASDFGLVQVRSFSRTSGYGFLDRDGEDVFCHVKVVRAAGLNELFSGDVIEARIAKGEKGLIAVEIREIVEEAQAA